MARTGATLDEVDSWMYHHLSGDWFISDLLKLIQKADGKNKEKLAMAYPDEFNIWWAWHHREASIKSRFSDET
jgi:hypothetical protein